MHTGKITIAAALLALSLGFGCQERRHHGQETARAGQDGQDLEAFTEDEIWAVPLASDLDFEQAVEA
ncbi:MAG: hypothetical protein ICV83_10850, partial [Cytophagales bacterium]|nr:hypothetical protein [Cytophagales bacterium]